MLNIDYLNKSWFELRALIFPRMTQLIELNVSSDWFTLYLRWLWLAKCGYLVSVSLPTLKIKTLWTCNITLQYHSTQLCSKYLIHHGHQWRKWTSHEPLHRCTFFWLASELSYATLGFAKKYGVILRIFNLYAQWFREIVVQSILDTELYRSFLVKQQD